MTDTVRVPGAIPALGLTCSQVPPVGVVTEAVAVTSRQVTERFTGALRRIAAGHPGERVIVVAHGGAMSMGLGDLLDGDYSSWRRMMENCAVSELVIEPAPELLSFNHTDHLEGL